MPLERIVSGGQTGVDRGALDAALAAGFPCGGWCPAGRRAEDGAIPARYPLTALPERDYAARTRRNVADSDATLILHEGRLEGGTALTRRFCDELDRPCLCVDPSVLGVEAAAHEAVAFIRREDVRVLNVAGPRDTKWPGASVCARKVVDEILRRSLYRAEADTSGGKLE